MSAYFKPRVLGLGLFLLALLAACGQPGTQTTTSGGSPDTVVPVEITTPTIEPVVFQPSAGTTMRWIDNSTVVYVPPGEFTMGKDEDLVSDHEPAHTVSLDGFWIHQTEVTNAMYQLCVDVGICPPPEQQTDAETQYGDPHYANYPVVGVSYNHARTYCEWAGGSLPTEAQWELAARGTEAKPYPWGEEDPTCDLLNYAGCLPHDDTAAVRSYPLGASPYDLADMAGNVFEWVSDWYAVDYYAASPTSNPTGPADGELRVLRSSSYQSGPDQLPVYVRSSMEPERPRADVGFRCVLSGDPQGQTTAFLPACQVLQYVPKPVDQPIPEPNVSVEASTSCAIDENNNAVGLLFLEWPLGTDISDMGIYAGDEPDSPELDCYDTDINAMTCTGAPLTPGNSYELFVCDSHLVWGAAEVAPTCPEYYEYSTESKTCEYVGPPAAQCGPGSIDVPGYGCQLLQQNGDCPTGSYPASYQNQAVCVPAGGPPCQGENCPAACPPGLTFDPQQLCCEYPPAVEAICPVGYLHWWAPDGTMDACWSPADYGCTYVDITVPTCFPLEQGCWVKRQNPAGGTQTVCISPCPDDGDPINVCTP